MKSIIIAGGTGLIGKRLTSLLVDRGFTVHILTRQNLASNDKIKYFQWHIEEQLIDLGVFKDAVGLINLTGAGIADKRWSKARKVEIMDSRIIPARFLQQVMRENEIELPVYVSASGSSFYPNSDGKHFVESDLPGSNFIHMVCVNWESQALAMESNFKRIAILRTGVVLAKSGSFLQKFTATVKFFVAGIFGNGKQALSWIHIDDLCNVYIMAIQNSTIRGVYNAGICNHESHYSFIKAYLEASNRKAIILKAPTFISKLIFGEMSILLNSGVSMSHDKIKVKGFKFQFENLSEAIKNLNAV